MDQAAGRLLDFGVPMTGNYSLGLVCAYCGSGVAELQTQGHRRPCVWWELREAFLRARATAGA